MIRLVVPGLLVCLPALGEAAPPGDEDDDEDDANDEPHSSDDRRVDDTPNSRLAMDREEGTGERRVGREGERGRREREPASPGSEADGRPGTASYQLH